MKISKELKKQVEEKSKKLKKAKKILKKEFIGLDEIIDEVFGLIEPWFLFPKLQVRPTIINLWGMTGVGKTSLVVRIFELLGIKTVYKFDIGDFCGDNSDHKLKYKISESLFKIGDDDKFVLVFDEFQLGRTMTEMGDEIERGALRILWDLYDTGKIEIINSSYNTAKMFILSQKLEECVSNGVTIRDGIVSANEEFFRKTFGITKKKDGEKNKNSSMDSVIDEENEEDEILTFIPSYYFWTIQEIWDKKFTNTNEVINYIRNLNEKETVKFINDTLEQSIIPTLYDFSNSVIFNIGNIDEAYHIANDINPDSDADFLYNYTKKITLPQIKEALMKRFRPEQISRLGNNHIIYRSFTSQQYRHIIKLQLTKFILKIKERFDLEIILDESIYEILYKEGVFPTQGTRPVFSTITSLVESYTGKIILDIIKNGENGISKIKWSYNNKKHSIDYLDDNDVIIFSKKYPVVLKTENLRENTKDDLQALTALHEAGHAVCAMMAIEMLPKHVVSKTADANAGGFCMLEFPRYRSAKLMKNDITYTLGGYAAEKLIFGEDNLTTGSHGDLESSTISALTYVKTYGMTGNPMQFSSPHPSIAISRADQNIINTDKIANDIVKTCLENATDILEREKVLLIEIAKYLSEHNRIDSEKLKEFHDKYALRKVNFKNKENYYNFKEILGNSK